MRTLRQIVCAGIGFVLMFLAWYGAGGRDGSFELAYLLGEGQNLLFAAGGLFFVVVAIVDRIRSRRATMEPTSTVIGGGAA